jgi:hypothetical protein
MSILFLLGKILPVIISSHERKTAALGVPRKRVLGVKVLLRARGLPSKGEARALHHQPAPSVDLGGDCAR